MAGESNAPHDDAPLQPHPDAESLMEQIELLETTIAMYAACREVQSASKQEKFCFIQGRSSELRIADMCRTLDVSESGYYDWLKRGESNHAREDREFGELIETIFNRHNGIYGSPRIHAELLDTGFQISCKRVARLMKERGLSARIPKRFVRTTLSDHDRRIADNVLNRRFRDAKWEIDDVWIGDITYIPTGEGWVYLATMIDLVSKKVVGWSIADHMRDELCIEALNDAVARRGRKDLSGLLHHTDRGSQYASDDYIAELEKQGMERSMSRKGNCWDNSPAESFFATLKKECVHRATFSTKREAIETITEYIEVFYNRVRRHSSIGYVCPEVYERINK